MIKVLFICHGNICRSPMAEFIFKDMVSKQGLSYRFYIASAATSTEEIWNGIGNPVYPPAQEELAKHVIDCKGKRAVQLTKADYDKYDYILGMDYWNLKNMLRILKSDQRTRLSFFWIIVMIRGISQIHGIQVDLMSHIQMWWRAVRLFWNI